MTRPSPARIYDFLLGGKDNFQVDREAALEVESRLPNVRKMMQANRAFLRRAVHFLAECGVRQFIDIGSGLPTPGNVHEIAQAVAPDSRVVYVDNDPIVLSHGRALLTDSRTRIVTADLRDPNSILEDPQLRELIDPGEPVALLLVAVLHFILDEENPAELVRTFQRWMAPGSYLALSHVDHTENVAAAAKVYDQATSRAVPRSRDEVQELFGDFELVAPGLVQVSEWRPDGELERQLNMPWWGGVAWCPDRATANV